MRSWEHRVTGVWSEGSSPWPRVVLATAVLVSILVITGCTAAEPGDTTAQPGGSSPTQASDVPLGGDDSREQQEVALPDLPAPEMTFPADAGLVNVVEEYGARGDGISDDTEAIQQAIGDNVGRGRTLFFPAGTYLVSAPLEWRDGDDNWQPWLTIQGQGRDLTVIKLMDGAEGYGDSGQPRGVLVTASGEFRGNPTGGGKDYVGLGEGAEAFKNYIFDLTVDVGRDNPGAVGIDFLANNNGGVENVTIRSGDGEGATGLGMTRQWPGPALIKNVRIDGFDYGVSIDHTEYGVTFEHLVLVDQHTAGIRNDGNVLSIHGLTSRNAVPVIRNVSPLGLIALVEAQLGGGGEGIAAIDNQGHVYLRDVDAYGYQSVLAGLEGTSVREFATSELFTDTAPSLGLPIEETPASASADLSDWANVTDPAYSGGASPFDENDDTAAVQAALDSGLSTIYFPSAGQPGEGRYLIGDTLIVPSSVERIIGFDSFIAPGKGNRFQDDSQPRALFQFEGGDAQQTVSLERLRFGRYGNVEAPGVIWIEHASPRTLVVKHVILGGGDSVGYRGLSQSGRLFLEDYCCSNIELDHTQGVWARQLNIERNKTMIRNRATFLWILGIKTERPSTVIETTDGGESELVGGLLYPADEVSPDTPAFVSVDSELSLVYAVSAYVNADYNYTIQIEETDNGETELLRTEEVPGRNLGSTVPFHNGSS
jgi:hypothetical protein